MTAPSIKEALEQAEAAFEAIRLTLINNLEEPERSAFWAAVTARDEVRAALATLSQPTADRREIVARDNEPYLVWSNEHSAWWGPDHRGYNTHISRAGRYTRDEALKICIGARGGREFNRNPSEVPILVSDAEKFWTEDDLEKQRRREARQRQEEDQREEIDGGADA